MLRQAWGGTVPTDRATDGRGGDSPGTAPIRRSGETTETAPLFFLTDRNGKLVGARVLLVEVRLADLRTSMRAAATQQQNIAKH